MNKQMKTHPFHTKPAYDDAPEGALVPANINDLSDLQTTSEGAEESFKSIASSDFLPRFELSGSNSNLAKTGAVPVGTYTLVRSKDDFTSLGKTVKAFICAWRPKALDTASEPIMFSYDARSPDFAAIMKKSELPDSGCMYGPEFLLYLDGQGFATYFCGSKTTRNVAPKIKSNMHKVLTFTAALIDGGKFKWHGPVVTEYDGQFTLTTKDELQKQITKFITPPKPTVERDDSPTGDDRPR